MAKLSQKEKKYLDEKLSLIRAIITGSLAGAYMFPPKDDNWGDLIQHQTDVAMEIIEKDVKNIYNYAKKRI